MALVNCTTLLPTLIDWIRHEATEEQIVLIQTLLNCENSDPDSTHDDVTLTVVPTSAPEGTTFTFTVGLGSPVTGTPLSVNVALSNTEQTAHSYPSPRLVVIPVGATSGFFTVATVNDAAGGGNTLLTGTVQTSPRVLNSPSATATVTPLSGSCVPVWLPTGTFQCNLVLDIIELEMTDTCGNTAWWPGRNIIWTQVGGLTCVDESYVRTEVSECGDERTIDTGVDCGGTCVPNWQNVVPQQLQCTNPPSGAGVVNVLQADGCGNQRWWFLRPVTWADTGQAECVDGTIHTVQVNDCGVLRIHDTQVACCDSEWTDVPGVTQCSTGRFLQRQTDGCGNYRWDDRGAVVYTAVVPQVIQCVGNDVEELRENQCGGTDWFVIGPIVWTDVAPLDTRCQGGFLEKRQTNQCGTSRWVLTTSPGTPCNVVPAPILPAQIEARNFECCYDTFGNPGNPTGAETTLTIRSNGQIESHNECGAPKHVVGTWLPSGQVNSSYQFRVARTSAPVSAGGWVTATSNSQVKASCLTSNMGVDVFDFDIYWRPNGSSDPTGTLYFSGSYSASCNGPC
jgi:hypothetical protein